VENIVQPGRPQIAVCHMRIAKWIPKCKNATSECVIFIVFPLQQCWYERASKLRYTYFACLVFVRTRKLLIIDCFVCEVLGEAEERVEHGHIM